MALVSSQASAEHVGPPSPSLTNPDMILPYHSSPPAAQQARHVLAASPYAGTRIPHRDSQQSHLRISSNSSGANRHSGSSHDTEPETGSKASKGPTFASTVDPRLRADLTSESSEYSPSIYSPTDSEGGPLGFGSNRNSFQKREQELRDGKRMAEWTDSTDSTSTLAVDEDENDPFSHAALSVRAEEILASAKKRLTAMENNLTRARSLSLNRSASAASTENPPFVSPPSSSLELNMKGNARPFVAKHLQDNFADALPSPGHSRGFSDTSIPNPTAESGTRDRHDRLRVTSATGASLLSGNRRRGGSPDDRQPSDTNNSHRPPRLALEPLREDELMPTPGESPSSSYRGSPAPFERAPKSELWRPRSQMQLRDLREQMQDLRGKITSLKQRTREESLQRRSLQMLKTPSPFTEAPDWATAAAPFREQRDLSSSSGKGERSPDRAAETRPAGRNSFANERMAVERNTEQDVAGQAERKMSEMTGTTDESERSGVFGSRRESEEHAFIGEGAGHQIQLDHFSPHSEHAEFADEDEYDAEISAYSAEIPHDEKAVIDEEPLASEVAKDAAEQPAYERDIDHEREENEEANRQGYRHAAHEDRPDAFDYETYITNSTMGSFSRQGHRSRSHSRSSASSASTARALANSPEHSPPIGRKLVEEEYDEDVTPQKLKQQQLQQQQQQSANEPAVNPLANGLPLLQQPPPHARHGSVDSVSTVATFATAASRAPSRSNIYASNASANMSTASFVSAVTGAPTHNRTATLSPPILRAGGPPPYPPPTGMRTPSPTRRTAQTRRLRSRSGSSPGKHLVGPSASTAGAAGETVVDDEARASVLAALTAPFIAAASTATIAEAADAPDSDVPLLVAADEALLADVVDGLLRACAVLSRRPATTSSGGRGAVDARAALIAARKALAMPVTASFTRVETGADREKE